MKNVILLLISVMLINFTSCKKEEDEGAVVKVQVLENGGSKTGITVCLFSSNKGPNSSFFTPFHSNKKIITEGNGIATFDLQSVHDLEVLESQTTFYFGVFNNKDVLLGNTAMTIQQGEIKNVKINI